MTNRDQETDEDARGTCGWCGDLAELVDADLADSFVEAHHGRDEEPGQGSCIWIPYGEFCESCFDAIREEWIADGTVTRPATAWGAA